MMGRLLQMLHFFKKEHHTLLNEALQFNVMIKSVCKEKIKSHRGSEATNAPAVSQSRSRQSPNKLQDEHNAGARRD